MKKVPNEKSKKATTLLEWAAPEYIKHPKGQLWLFMAGSLIIFLVWYAIYTGSWTMAVAFIVLAGVYYLSHHSDPKQIMVKLTSFGIQVGNQKIPYNQIKAFWLVYKPPNVKTLKLLLTDRFMSDVTIQLDGQTPGEVRSVLLRHVPELEGKEESFVDMIIRTTKL